VVEARCDDYPSAHECGIVDQELRIEEDIAMLLRTGSIVTDIDEGSSYQDKQGIVVAYQYSDA